MAKTPTNKAGRKPTGKKPFSLANFKEKTNTVNVKEKPLRWLKCSKAFQEELGIPGFPVGYVSLTRGHSNTGKSTSLCEAIVDAQKQNILPIIIDTENNLGESRLKKMGFDWEGGFYIKISNDYLLEQFGKPKDPKRELASIEDLAECVNYFLNMQKAGELPYDLLFAIDSIGTLDCNRTVNALENETSDNNMWNAGVYEKRFKPIINYRIPASRSVDSEYTNSMVAVQKIWLQANQMGAPTVKHKGGDTFTFAARLIIHHGGVISASVKKITATSKKRDVQFGNETKIAVVKNHIDGEFGGISLEGKLISTPHGFIGTTNDGKTQYKKDHIQYFRDILDEDVSAEDIVTKYVDDGSGGFTFEDVEEKLDELKEGKERSNQDLMDDFENDKNDDKE